MSNKRKDLHQAISDLAELYETGPLLASINPEVFLERVAEEVRDLRARLEAMEEDRHSISEAHRVAISAWAHEREELAKKNASRMRRQ